MSNGNPLQPPVPPWTPAMQELWNRAMLLARTRGAYGCAFPMPGSTYPPPQSGTMLYDILFTCTASVDEYCCHLEDVRNDMLAWKARVAASRGKNKLLSVRDTPVRVPEGLLANVEIKL